MEAALRAVDRLSCNCILYHHEIEAIRSALHAADRQNKAWKAIEQWCLANSHRGPSLFFAGKWHGSFTDHVSSICSGETREEVFEKLADWCKSELQWVLVGSAK